MKMLLAVAAGLVGYCYYAGSCSRNARRLPIKEELNRWEGEGPVPNTSYPQVDPGLRH